MSELKALGIESISMIPADFPLASKQIMIRDATRLSGFPCKGRFRYANLNLPLEYDGELRFRHVPFARRHSPFFLRQVQHEHSRLAE